MHTITFLKVWFISYIGFFLLDMLTHMVMLQPLFASELGGLMRSAPIMPLIFLQTIIISMVTVYLVWKTTRKSMLETATVGAVIGLLIYAIHEFSNFASLDGWSSTVMIAHTIVGVAQMAIVAIWVDWVIKKFGKN